MSDPTREALDAAYRERNAVIAALLRTNGWPVYRIDAPDAPGWFIVYAETPAGQVSWHVGPDDIDLFDAPVGGATWDGHTTEEKYRRLAALSTTPAPLDVERRICTLSVGHGGLHRGDDGSEWTWFETTHHRSPALSTTPAPTTGHATGGNHDAPSTLPRTTPAPLDVKEEIDNLEGFLRGLLIGQDRLRDEMIERVAEFREAIAREYAKP